MPGGASRVYNLGKVGVSIDSNDTSTQPGAFVQTQNAHRDPLGEAESLVNRAGLRKFTTSDTAGSVLGGAGVALLDHFSATTRVSFIGKGGVGS